MGACSSKQASSETVQDETHDQFTSLATPGSRQSGRRASLGREGLELPELQSKLEKLDEERTRVQEELRRLQSAAALDQDGESDGTGGSGGSGGDKPRVRFSKFDGIDATMATSPQPASDRTPQVSRRVSSGTTMGRLSSYRAGNSNEAAQNEPRQDKLASGRDIKALTEMVNRGRRRTRYTHRSSGSAEQPSSSTDPSVSIHYLPRGGVHVTTKYGAVQFGLPPETIKDAMQLDLQVPGIFVVPKDRFNLKYGTNTAEIEFPGYWNFFIKGRSPTLVCTSEAANVLSRVVDETLEGVREPGARANARTHARVRVREREREREHGRERAAASAWRRGGRSRVRNSRPCNARAMRAKGVGGRAWRVRHSHARHHHNAQQHAARCLSLSLSLSLSRSLALSLARSC